MKKINASLFILIGFSYFMISCSKDDMIIGDYKIYDLDGSNQVIIGNEGMATVFDVTAYKLEGRKIIFETGALGLKDKVAMGQKSNSCRYGFIDSENGVIVPAEPDSKLSKIIHDKLTLSRKGSVSRSCIGKR